ncbi:MAG: hypothetical protein IPI73_18280 [Betaproteobacteria bacterium]|nr:hypothetical protein [Betaproteobacteria bacterium]
MRAAGSTAYATSTLVRLPRPSSWKATGAVNATGPLPVCTTSSPAVPTAIASVPSTRNRMRPGSALGATSKIFSTLFVPARSRMAMPS